MPSRPRRIGDGKRGPARLSVNGTDRGLRARRSASTERPASVGTSPCQPDLTLASAGKALPWKTCASNMNSKPWRGSSARRCRDFFACLRHRRDTRPVALFATGTPVAREAPAVLFLEGIGVACSFRRLWRDLRRKSSKQEFESGVRLGSRFRGAISADVPDALTRHNRNLSPSASSS